MSSTDLVGYMFDADIYHYDCLARGWFPELADPEVAVTVAVTEAALDKAAAADLINRHDERTFDSSEHPKVIFEDQVQPGSKCGACNELMLP